MFVAASNPTTYFSFEYQFDKLGDNMTFDFTVHLQTSVNNRQLGINKTCIPFHTWGDGANLINGE
jgi:hypothetical protein